MGDPLDGDQTPEVQEGDGSVGSAEGTAEGTAEGQPGGPSVTVALVQPDASRRALLERKLARSPRIDVVLSGGDPDEIVPLVIEQLPDVVAAAPTEGLQELVAELEEVAPAVAVLVLDPGPEEFPALGLGARGTLPSGGSEITKAVLGIARDEAVLTPDWAALLLEAISGLEPRVRRFVVLTETEREVLQRLADGETPRAIADDHDVTERLVNLHVGYAVGKYQRATEALRVLAAHDAATAGAVTGAVTGAATGAGVED